MSYKFRGFKFNGIFYFTLIIIPWPSIYAAEIGGEIGTLQVHVTKARLGEYCRVSACETNQFCDTNYECHCLPGYKAYNNDCVLFAGENEKCTRREDCNGKLFCINGLCRKPRFNEEFAILAKICLGITIITIIIAVFSSLIKCLIKYDASPAFRRQSDASSTNFTPMFNENVYRSRTTLYEVQEEKPPSYEECIRSSEPPPYVISSNSVSLTSESSIIQSGNLNTVNAQNETPLSIQNLSQKINLEQN